MYQCLIILAHNQNFKFNEDLWSSLYLSLYLAVWKEWYMMICKI